MFHMVEAAGDTVAVPRVVFAKLGTNTGEARFRVALYMCAGGAHAPAAVAKALKLPLSEVEKALEFWEGAGLLARDGAAARAADAGVQDEPPRRTHMNTPQVAEATMADATLKAMLHELQRIHGGVVSPKDNQIYATLYCEDGFSADLVLMAAMHLAERGVSARSVEGLLLKWQRLGVSDAEAANRHLMLLGERAARYEKTAAAMGVTPKAFNAAERRMIDAWGEEYGYGEDMVREACLAAGEKATSARYLNGILGPWHAKGYKTPKDVQRAQSGQNTQVIGGNGPGKSGGKTPGKTGDMLADRGYVPLPRKKGT